MMDEEERHEVIEKHLGIVKPFPPNPKIGDRFRRVKQPNPITGEPSHIATYEWDGIHWLEVKE